MFAVALNFCLFFCFSFSKTQKKGTVVEKLVEEVVKDGQHLQHIIRICEGNL